MMEPQTPMMKQYFELKEQNPDCLLFFRLGDFYELFYDDAELVSRELDLTLTGRASGNNMRAPMCGVPHHAVNTYIGRLIEKGYKVAIAEQMEDPALAKGLVSRDIIRIVTPGTLLEDNLLIDDRNNYIACLLFSESKLGLAFSDISTGEFSVCVYSENTPNRRIIDELIHLNASELITTAETFEYLQKQSNYNRILCSITMQELSDSDYLTQHFSRERDLTCISSLNPLCRLAANQLLSYLFTTQKGSIRQVTRIETRELNEYINLDPATINSLEVVSSLHGNDKKRSLLGVLDRTNTAMGARLLRSWIEHPLSHIATIESRLDSVEFFYNNQVLCDTLAAYLSQIRDLERLCTRIIGANTSPRDLLSLSSSLAVIPQIIKLFEQKDSVSLSPLINTLDPLTALAHLIESAISEDAPLNAHDPDVIRKGYNEELDNLKDIQKNGHSWIASLEARERERTGIKNLRINYNRVFGYYIEVTKSYYDLVPINYVRKQTLSNSERFTTEELHDIETKILTAQEQISQKEFSLFSEIKFAACECIETIQKNAQCLACLDVYSSLAITSRLNHYTRPRINESSNIIIKGGRHPVVEILKRDVPFVPNDTLLDNSDNRFLIITGPNMAGKSTYLRQVALIALMAQIGCFVPAESAEIGLIDGIYTRIGASDDLSSGQSTFMLEMNEVAHILQNATPSSLIILDEVGRGTSTFDGLSIAWAITEYISQSPAMMSKTLFATHYHELTVLEGNLPGVKNYCIAVRERGDKVYFLRQIRRGTTDKSFGIHVARLANLPESVLKRANKILKQLEKTELSKQTSKIMSNSDATSDVNYGKQIGMFADDTSSIQVLSELRDLVVDRLTPIDALNILNNLQKKLRNGNDSK